jgi:hypothetical protein
MNEEVEQPQAPEQEPAAGEEISEKSDKPKVELYVMSFCPYGNLAEDTMYPVYQQLKDKVDREVHYIVSDLGNGEIRSLHGQPETDQNIREMCVMKYDGMDAFWKFITYVNQNCGRDGACWEDAAAEAGADVDKIKECYDNEGIELMQQEAAASSAAGASGSPTMKVNGVKTTAVYNYGKSDVYKSTICSAFNEAPEGCGDALADVEGTEVAGGSC